MAVLEKRKGRGADALSGAAKGAAAGAIFGVPGAVVGGALGGVGGALLGGSALEAMQEEELAELKRRQEMGALGLTDEEMAAIRGQGAGQLGRQFAQQQALQAGIAATQGGGAGQFAADSASLAAEQVKANQDLANELRKADNKERMLEEARMVELGGKLDKAAQERQAQVFESIMEAADVAEELGVGQDEEAIAFEKIQERIATAERLKELGVDLEGADLEALIGDVQSMMRTGA